MKKFAKVAACAALALTCIASAACADFDASKSINVISREDGSGTRGAFIELTGVEQKVDGQKVDMTTVDAQITNNTAVMIATVGGDSYAIGYVSLGSMNDTVKAVKVEGVEATAQTVADGTYKVARPFNIAYKEDTLSDLGKDFVAYIMSAEGQAIINENGYVGGNDAAAYAGNAPEGKLVIAGSSSVSPVMEKLVEAYCALNTGATIEVQTSDSTTGMTSAMDGTCDIGMASRELKEEEAAALTAQAIAMDGIAVIVSNDNPVEDLSVEQIAAIFTGEVTNWDEVIDAAE
ncbi:MAG TPA: substrate-binding domain-containing protein [Candidatus Ventricola gallistercoris]|nr:substrate-binding domain-containing protein [Candidatus Ventricola gallistercoris]